MLARYEEKDPDFRDAVKIFASDREAHQLVLGEVLSKNIRDKFESHAYWWNLNQKALDDWPIMVRTLEQGRRQSFFGAKTGLNWFDDRAFGLDKLTILAGESGSGRTTMALNLFSAALLNHSDLAVLYFSLRLDKGKLYERVLSKVSEIPWRRLNSMEPELLEKKENANRWLRANVLPRLLVTDLGAEKSLTPNAICDEIKSLKTNTRTQKVLVIIDPVEEAQVYVDHSSMTSDGQPTERRERLTDRDAEDERMRRLQNVYERTYCPILIISGVRKPDGVRKRLSLADIPGSADIVARADRVLLIEPQSRKPSDVVPVVLNFAKVTDGGTRDEIKLDFLHTVSTFRPSGATASRPSAADVATKAIRRGAGK